MIAPIVSVIVAVRDGARFLAEALDSLRRQSRPPDEIIVVDGGSTDGTEAVARSVPGIRFMQQCGDGLGDARNSGIRAARGEVIGFLDHDDCWTPDKLETQLPLLAALPAPAGTIAYLRTVCASLPEVHPPRPRLGEPQLGRTPGTLLAHRGVFERVGEFDTTLTVGTDMDWFARCADLGVPLAVASQVLLVKRIHPASLSADPAGNRRDAFSVLRQSLARRRAGA
jgi:glycosyltransferase involved in cell wall biosynthesis